jgi:prolyl 4-hydroxylase
MPAASGLFLWSAVFTLLSCTSAKQEPSSENVIISSSLDTDACRIHPYKTHLLSEDPLVIYIDSFITREEASQLVGLR